MDLRVVSYNCFSIRKRIDPIKDILQNNDILFCQEIILLKDDCSMLEQLDISFEVLYVPSRVPEGHGDGRPIGGLAIFYRKSLGLDVRVVEEHENFQFIKIIANNETYFLGNIYICHAIIELLKRLRAISACWGSCSHV